MPDVSVIIVNYRTGLLLSGCLESIRRNLACDYEVIVADNGSDDGSVAACSEFWNDRRFRCIATGGNVGFAKANNIAASEACGRIFHFLNPDTEIGEGMDEDYRTALSFPDRVYVNPLFNADGSLENDMMPVPLVRDLFFWNVCRRKARIWYKGASVIMSAETFGKVGGWSEDYFLYAEDLDLFFRLERSGTEICSLRSGIFHLGGGSSSSVWSSIERETVVQRSNRLFYRKHSNVLEYVAVKLYFLMHTLLKRPSKVPFYVRAWYLSAKRK